MMWLYQRVEVFEHLDKVKITDWLIEADSKEDALAVILKNGKFQDVRRLIKYLTPHMDLIVDRISIADAEKIEIQGGLEYWKQVELVQNTMPEPQLSPGEIAVLGLKHGVFKNIEDWVLKPDTGSYYLKKIEKFT